MDNDPLDGLFPAESGATQTAAPEPTPAATANDPPVTEQSAPGAQPAQPRDPAGRFAPKAGETAPDPTATPSPAKPSIDPEQFKGYLDEREKRQAAEKRIAEFEARERQREEQAQQQARIPSVHDEPEAYARYLAEQTQRIALGTRFETSETIAREKHGDEAVGAAMEWAMQRAQTSPQFAAEYLRQKHPIDWAVKQQKRDALVSQLGDDPDEFVRRRAAELGLLTAPQPEPQPSPAASPQSAVSTAKPQPVRSLASAPSAGGMGAVGMAPEQAFEAVFKR